MEKTEDYSITVCNLCYPDKFTPLTISEEESGKGYGYCEIHGKIYIKDINNGKN